MTASVDPTRMKLIIELGQCPVCQKGLISGQEAIQCCGCKLQFPILDGRPVFVDNPATVRVMPQDHISNQLEPGLVKWLKSHSGLVLNVGAGGSAEKIPAVIEMEYSLFRNTDLSADAHKIPFRDQTFDAVITYNTFEHLRDPLVASAEIYRVLKPGGRLILRTAFLQPVHEAPYHFYNATEFGVRHWFEQFNIHSVHVSDNFHPGFVLGWLVNSLLEAVKKNQGLAEYNKLKLSTLDQWSASWNNPKLHEHLWESIRTLPQELQSQFSAGFELDATKPGGSPDSHQPLLKIPETTRKSGKNSKNWFGQFLGRGN